MGSRKGIDRSIQPSSKPQSIPHSRTALPLSLLYLIDDRWTYKVIAIEAGHVCQNLYLACEAIDAGICAIAAYDQEKMDELLKVDEQDEIAVYIASVGKK